MQATPSCIRYGAFQKDRTWMRDEQDLAVVVCWTAGIWIVESTRKLQFLTREKKTVQSAFFRSYGLVAGMTVDHDD